MFAVPIKTISKSTKGYDYPNTLSTQTSTMALLSFVTKSLTRELMAKIPYKAYEFTTSVTTLLLPHHYQLAERCIKLQPRKGLPHSQQGQVLFHHRNHSKYKPSFHRVSQGMPGILRKLDVMLSVM